MSGIGKPIQDRRTTKGPDIPGGTLPPVLNEVPDLPEMDELRARARTRLEHFEQVKADAEAEIEKCLDFLGEKHRKRAPVRKRPTGRLVEQRVSEATYRRVLTALGNHAYAGAKTLASEAQSSTSHIGRTMFIAVERGHATVEVRSRGSKRWRITEAGEEFLTASAPMGAS